MDDYGPEGRLKLCNRLATQILLINNLQPELQNSASPSTRLHATISCIHLVCPAPSNTPWDQDQFISFLTNGTYVQAQSCCFNISAPALYWKNTCSANIPLPPGPHLTCLPPLSPLILLCPIPPLLLVHSTPSLPSSTSGPTTPLLPPPHLPPCFFSLTSLLNGPGHHLLQKSFQNPGRSNRILPGEIMAPWGCKHHNTRMLTHLTLPCNLSTYHQYKVHNRSPPDLLSE